MTRSELVRRVALRHKGTLAADDVELAVRNILEQMSSALARGDRIEIRDFGSFRVRYRQPGTGRNPATGGAVELHGRYVARFKPGKRLRDCVNEARGLGTDGGRRHAVGAHGRRSSVDAPDG